MFLNFKVLVWAGLPRKLGQYFLNIFLIYVHSILSFVTKHTRKNDVKHVALNLEAHKGYQLRVYHGGEDFQ